MPTKADIRRIHENLRREAQNYARAKTLRKSQEEIKRAADKTNAEIQRAAKNLPAELNRLKARDLIPSNFSVRLPRAPTMADVRRVREAVTRASRDYAKAKTLRKSQEELKRAAAKTNAEIQRARSGLIAEMDRLRRLDKIPKGVGFIVPSTPTMAQIQGIHESLKRVALNYAKAKTLRKSQQELKRTKLRVGTEVKRSAAKTQAEIKRAQKNLMVEFNRLRKIGVITGAGAPIMPQTLEGIQSFRNSLKNAEQNFIKAKAAKKKAQEEAKRAIERAKAQAHRTGSQIRNQGRRIGRSIRKKF